MLTHPIALTMGDIDAIGPEISIKCWHYYRQQPDPKAFFIIGPQQLYRQTASHYGWPDPIISITDISQVENVFADGLPVLDIGDGDPVTSSIRKACTLALEGSVDAIVTNPITKASLHQAHINHPGHTEWIGLLCSDFKKKVLTPLMMLANAHLKVVPLTTHIRLAEVTRHINIDRITQALTILHQSLCQDFACAAPRIAVSALNPHAGEGGLMGDEETNIIQPAIAGMVKSMAITGPIAADSLFHAKARESYDAVLAMYHDQALIPLKTLDFSHSVNVTLGLPIVRTSPAHGTAKDIVGLGKASPDSLIEAIATARQIADRRADQQPHRS